MQYTFSKKNKMNDLIIKYNQEVRAIQPLPLPLPLPLRIHLENLTDAVFGFSLVTKR